MYFLNVFKGPTIRLSNTAKKRTENLFLNEKSLPSERMEKTLLFLENRCGMRINASTINVLDQDAKSGRYAYKLVQAQAIQCMEQAYALDAGRTVNPIHIKTWVRLHSLATFAQKEFDSEQKASENGGKAFGNVVRFLKNPASVVGVAGVALVGGAVIAALSGDYVLAASLAKFSPVALAIGILSWRSSSKLHRLAKKEGSRGAFQATLEKNVEKFRVAMEKAAARKEMQAAPGTPMWKKATAQILQIFSFLI